MKLIIYNKLYNKNIINYTIQLVFRKNGIFFRFHAEAFPTVLWMSSKILKSPISKAWCDQQPIAFDNEINEIQVKSVKWTLQMLFIPVTL